MLLETAFSPLLPTTNNSGLCCPDLPKNVKTQPKTQAKLNLSSQGARGSVKLKFEFFSHFRFFRVFRLMPRLAPSAQQCAEPMHSSSPARMSCTVSVVSFELLGVERMGCLCLQEKVASRSRTQQRHQERSASRCRTEFFEKLYDVLVFSYIFEKQHL